MTAIRSNKKVTASFVLVKRINLGLPNEKAFKLPTSLIVIKIAVQSEFGSEYVNKVVITSF